MTAQEITDDVGATPDIPQSIKSVLGDWARQMGHEAAVPLRERLAQTEGTLAETTADRDQALLRLTERDTSIEQLTIELRNARDIASNALVGKAKDQLAIEGKDSQLADLRRQLEQQVAASAAQSDARLAAEMDLVGAVTARDNFAAEVAELRAQLDACRGRVGAS